MLLKILIFLFFIRNAFTLNDTVRNFVSSFVNNEMKPAMLVLGDLCWNEHDQLLLAHELLNNGIRISKSTTNKSKFQEHDCMFLLDLDCENSTDIINMAITNRLFRSPFRWLILTSTEGWQSELEHIPALPDSDVVLAEKSYEQYSLFELHKPSLNFSLISTPRGYYNGSLADTRPHRELYRRRKDMMGHALTMSNVIQDSNSTRYHLPREDGLEFQYDAIAKITWMNARLAMELLNVTPKYIFSNRYGYKVNGQWSGMIDDIDSGRADFGTNLAVTDARLSVVAYTDPLAPTKLRFIFRQPPLSYVSNIYALPFKSNLWVGTAVCTIVSAVAMWIATRWEVMFGKSRTQLDGSVSDAVFLTMGALSQQECGMGPNKLSGRIMVWVVFAALMALHAAYSANIVALLQAPSNSITNLPQLAAAKITLAANDVDYNHFILKEFNFNDPVRVAIHTRVDPEKGKPQFYNIYEGVERIRKGLFAFHSICEPVYRRIEETFYESEKCDLMEIDYLNSFDLYVPMKKDSPYLELVKVAFKRVRESGLRSALNRRHQRGRPVCVSRVAFTSVGGTDVRAPIALLAVGAAGALALLLVEIFTHYLKKKYGQRNIKTSRN